MAGTRWQRKVRERIERERDEAVGQLRDLGITPDEIAEALVRQASETSARVVFVEDASLLTPVGGVVARLRYRIGGKAA